GEIVDGLDLARRRRPTAKNDVSLARGPGNLTRALGISMDDLDSNLDDGRPVSIDRSVPVVSAAISVGPRVGVRRAADVPWRFWFAADPTVSSYRRHPRAETRGEP
ncbi:3-methyladenine DNA glycosylase, partial [Streptomyces sp. SID10244]|nr:3-methyladenine DNA glycosylase [Streptomyces sp. SID10244]